MEPNTEVEVVNAEKKLKCKNLTLTSRVDFLYATPDEGSYAINLIINRKNSETHIRENQQNSPHLQDLKIDMQGSQLIILILKPIDMSIQNEHGDEFNRSLLVLQEDRNGKLCILNDYSNYLINFKFIKKVNYPNFEISDFFDIKFEKIKKLKLMTKRNRALINKLTDDYRGIPLDYDFILSLKRKPYEKIMLEKQADFTILLNNPDPHILRLLCRTNDHIKKIVDTPHFFKRYLKNKFVILRKPKTELDMKAHNQYRTVYPFFDVTARILLKEKPIKIFKDNSKKIVDGIMNNSKKLIEIDVSYIAYLVIIWDILFPKYEGKDGEIKKEWPADKRNSEIRDIINSYDRLIFKYRKFYREMNTRYYGSHGSKTGKLLHSSLLKMVVTNIPRKMSLDYGVICNIITYGNIDVLTHLIENENINFNENINYTPQIRSINGLDVYKLFISKGYRDNFRNRNLCIYGLDFIKYFQRTNNYNPSQIDVLKSGYINVIEYFTEKGFLNEINTPYITIYNDIILWIYSEEILNYCEEVLHIYPILNKGFIYDLTIQFLHYKHFIPANKKEIDYNKDYDFSMNIIHEENKRKSHFLYHYHNKDGRYIGEDEDEPLKYTFKVNIYKFINKLIPATVSVKLFKYLIEELGLISYFNFQLLLSLMYNNLKLVPYILNNVELKSILDSSVSSGTLYIPGEILDKWINDQPGKFCTLKIKDLMQYYHLGILRN